MKASLSVATGGHAVATRPWKPAEAIRMTRWTGDAGEGSVQRATETMVRAVVGLCSAGPGSHDICNAASASVRTAAANAALARAPCGAPDPLDAHPSNVLSEFHLYMFLTELGCAPNHTRMRTTGRHRNA